MTDDVDVVPLADGTIPAVVSGQQKLYRTIDRAIDIVTDIMEDENLEGYVRLNAATTILDRTGLIKRTHVEHHHEVTHGLDPQIEQMIERLKRTVEKRDAQHVEVMTAPTIIEDAEIVDEADITVEPDPEPTAIVLDFDTFLAHPPSDEI